MWFSAGGLVREADRTLQIVDNIEALDFFRDDTLVADPYYANPAGEVPGPARASPRRADGDGLDEAVEVLHPADHRRPAERLLVPKVPPELEAQVRDAAASCPEQAIVVS